ncbi:MAG: ABC transporter ATP-binding protein [Chloroflexi bacterium]|nr:ABC transporter ATP-binding protein [Chloroflexota bacterium]
MIELINLTKHFPGQGQGGRSRPLIAVDNLTMQVRPGELFGFLGPNGAGKTTTIKMMAGLLEPTSGIIKINGYDLLREGRKARSLLGYVPDTPHAYEKLTGREFVRFMADIFRVSRPDREDRIQELLELFELQEFADSLTETYSHGMRQKIVLAATLIHEPKVIFLDEPTTGLDPRSARRVKDILLRLCAQGTTVFMSTHILEIAERMCDRIGIINKGRLIALGTLAELRQMRGAETLEDIFLQVTGGESVLELTRVL